jgi:hypothetical protein
VGGVRHPERVRKIVACGAVYNNVGADEKTINEMKAATPDTGMFAMMRSMYRPSKRDTKRRSRITTR